MRSIRPARVNCGDEWTVEDCESKQYLVTRHKEVKALYEEDDINKVINVNFVTKRVCIRPVKSLKPGKSVKRKVA